MENFLEAYSSVILDIFKVAAPVLSAVFAGWAILASSTWSKKNHAYHAELKLMEQACSELEFSYNVLTSNGNNLPPQRDRLRWLESARAIQRFLEFEQSVRFHDLKKLLASRKEHWRHRFFVALDDEFLNNRGYFSGEGDNEIDEKSAFIVIRFTQWEENKEDIIYKHPVNSAEDMLEALGKIPASGFYYHLEAKRDGLPF